MNPACWAWAESGLCYLLIVRTGSPGGHKTAVGWALSVTLQAHLRLGCNHNPLSCCRWTDRKQRHITSSWLMGDGTGIQRELCFQMFFSRGERLYRRVEWGLKAAQLG